MLRLKLFSFVVLMLYRFYLFIVVFYSSYYFSYFYHVCYFTFLVIPPSFFGELKAHLPRPICVKSHHHSQTASGPSFLRVGCHPIVFCFALKPRCFICSSRLHGPHAWSIFFTKATKVAMHYMETAPSLQNCQFLFS